jgi:hypothetical protein
LSEFPPKAGADFGMCNVNAWYLGEFLKQIRLRRKSIVWQGRFMEGGEVGSCPYGRGRDRKNGETPRNFFLDRVGKFRYNTSLSY